MYTRAQARASTPLSCHPFPQVPPLKSGYLSLPSCAFPSPPVAFPSRRFASHSLGSVALLYHSNGNRRPPR